jgi:hypothetical protein
VQLLPLGATPLGTAKENPGYVLRVSVRACESLRLKVKHKPVKGNPAHCELELAQGTTKPQIAAIRENFLRSAALLRVENDQVIEVR